MSFIQNNQFLKYKKEIVRLIILISIFRFDQKPGFQLLPSTICFWCIGVLYYNATITDKALHSPEQVAMHMNCWWKHAHKCTHKWLEKIWVPVAVTNFWRVKMEYRGDIYIYPIRWHRRSWMERPWRRRWPRYCCEGTVPPRTSRRCCWPLCTDSARWSAYRTNPGNTEQRGT